MAADLIKKVARNFERPQAIIFDNGKSRLLQLKVITKRKLNHTRRTLRTSDATEVART